MSSWQGLFFRECSKLTQRRDTMRKPEKKKPMPGRPGIGFLQRLLQLVPHRCLQRGPLLQDRVCHRTQVPDVTKSGQTLAFIDQSLINRRSRD
jgi:hypothetical protein